MPVNLKEKRSLKLLLTSHDYPEPEMIEDDVPFVQSDGSGLIVFAAILRQSLKIWSIKAIDRKEMLFEV